MFPPVFEGFLLDLRDIQWCHEYFRVARVLDAALVFHRGDRTVVRHEGVVLFDIRDTVMDNTVLDEDVAGRNRVDVAHDTILATTVHLLGHAVIDILALLVFGRSRKERDFLTWIEYHLANPRVPYFVGKHHVRAGEQVSPAARPCSGSHAITPVDAEKNPCAVARLGYDFHRIDIVVNVTVKSAIGEHTGHDAARLPGKDDNGTLVGKQGRVEIPAVDHYAIRDGKVAHVSRHYDRGSIRPERPDWPAQRFQLDGVAVVHGHERLDDRKVRPVPISATDVDTVTEAKLAVEETLGDIGTERHNNRVPAIHVCLIVSTRPVFLLDNDELAYPGVALRLACK